MTIANAAQRPGLAQALGAFMAILAILLIAAFNCGALFVLSLPIVASDGGGGGDALETMLTFGFACIAIATISGLVALIRGKAALGITISALALPFAWVLGMTVLIGGRALGFNIG